LKVFLHTSLGIVGETIELNKHLVQAFFLTPAAEKTKTQGQNSSKKLKEKLNLWEDVPSHLQNSRKKLNFMKLSHQNSKFSKG